MPHLTSILHSPASSITLLALLLAGCGETETSGPITDESSQESVTSTPELGSAIPDPFQVVTEVPDAEVPDSNGDETEGGDSGSDSPTGGDSESGELGMGEPEESESEPSSEPQSELPEFDENGVPYCD